MAKPARISEAEMHLLQLLWEDSPQGAVEIAERIGADRGWSIKTVKTLLSRLVAKGAITAETHGRRYLYRPAVEREPVVADEARGLLDRLFGGRVSPLVAQLADQKQLSDEDIAELEALVRSLKK